MTGTPSIRSRDRVLKVTREKLKAARDKNALLLRYVAALEALAVRSMDNDPATIRRIARLKKGVAL